MTDANRTPTPIDTIADAWVDTLAEREPTLATYIGRFEHNGRFGDYSPEGADALIADARSTKAALEAADEVDSIDAVTKMDLVRELDLMIEKHDAKTHLRDLNVIASPAQDIRATFDLMPTATVEDWSTISDRLTALPAAIDGYVTTLRRGIAEGVVPARRQVNEVVTQIGRYTADTGFFAAFVGDAAPAEGQLPASLARDLSTNANAARLAYDALANFLSSELAPVAGDEDAVGRELYALHSRHFLGAEVDLDETYEWGVEELARMVAEQEAIANEILPGASVEEAVAFLEKDESRKLRGTQALQEWMQRTSDRAVEELGRTHFDIAEPIRRLECMIAPTNEGGIYYTGPTDDFSRPGRMWWSVPEGVDTFDTWRELTPSITRAFRGTTCRSPRPSTTAPNSTRGDGSSPAPAGTPRGGRCTPSASWSSWATWTTPPIVSACSTVSACAPPVSCSTSACTCASRASTAPARGITTTRSRSC